MSTHSEPEIPSSKPVACPNAWGDWQFDACDYTLNLFVGECVMYAIDLENCRTPEEVLDRVFPLVGKPWVTAKMRSDLLDALVDLLNPQLNLCPGGESRVIDPVAVIHKANPGGARS